MKKTEFGFDYRVVEGEVKIAGDKAGVELALSAALLAHLGQKDRDGNPYILHPLIVGLMGQTNDEMIVGFMHDVLEDSSLPIETLENAGFSKEVLEALRLLTHEKEVPYFDYVQKIADSGNPLAIHVKYNDLKHNSARGKAYPDLQEKHGKALEMIKKAMEVC